MNLPTLLRVAVTTAAILASLLLSALTATAARAKWLSRWPWWPPRTAACSTLPAPRGTGCWCSISAQSRLTRSIATPPSPTGVALSADGKTLLVTCAGPQSQVCVVELVKGRVVAKLPAGHTAMSPVLSPDAKTVFVCNRFNDDVSVVDLASARTLRRILWRREPIAAAITPDGGRLLVANHLPQGRADVDHVGAVVSVIDTARGRWWTICGCPAAAARCRTSGSRRTASTRW